MFNLRDLCMYICTCILCRKSPSNGPKWDPGPDGPMLPTESQAQSIDPSVGVLDLSERGIGLPYPPPPFPAGLHARLHPNPQSPVFKPRSLTTLPAGPHKNLVPQRESSVYFGPLGGVVVAGLRVSGFGRWASDFRGQASDFRDWASELQCCLTRLWALDHPESG